jgi:hypothetical protein
MWTARANPTVHVHDTPHPFVSTPSKRDESNEEKFITEQRDILLTFLNIKVKSLLCLTTHHTMKIYGGVEGKLHTHNLGTRWR